MIRGVKGGRRYETSVFCRMCTEWIYREELEAKTHFNRTGRVRCHNYCGYQVSMNNRHRNMLGTKRY